MTTTAGHTPGHTTGSTADPAQVAALARIRKVLAKAEDPAATPEEAETYTAKAAEMIAAYGIDRALLAAEVPTSDVVGDRVVVLDRPYALDKASLLSGVAHALRCQAVRRVRHVGPEATKEISIHLFGHASDLERVDLLFTSLLLQATTRLARTDAPPWESLAAYRRSWLAGFTAAVVQRLQEAEQRAGDEAQRSNDQRSTGGPSVALVLRDRTRAVADAVDAAYPRLGTATPRSLSGSGGASGWAAGQRADLGGQRLAGARRQLGGGLRSRRR